MLRDSDTQGSSGLISPWGSDSTAVFSLLSQVQRTFPEHLGNATQPKATLGAQVLGYDFGKVSTQTKFPADPILWVPCSF